MIAVGPGGNPVTYIIDTLTVVMMNPVTGQISEWMPVFMAVYPNWKREKREPHDTSIKYTCNLESTQCSWWIRDEFGESTTVPLGEFEHFERVGDL